MKLTIYEHYICSTKNYIAIREGYRVGQPAHLPGKLLCCCNWNWNCNCCKCAPQLCTDPAHKLSIRRTYDVVLLPSLLRSLGSSPGRAFPALPPPTPPAASGCHYQCRISLSSSLSLFLDLPHAACTRFLQHILYLSRGYCDKSERSTIFLALFFLSKVFYLALNSL